MFKHPDCPGMLCQGLDNYVDQRWAGLSQRWTGIILGLVPGYPYYVGLIQMGYKSALYSD